LLAIKVAKSHKAYRSKNPKNPRTRNPKNSRPKTQESDVITHKRRWSGGQMKEVIAESNFFFFGWGRDGPKPQKLAQMKNANSKRKVR